MNNHEFTLMQLRNILNIAIKGGFVPFDAHFIFRTPGNHDALKALRTFLLGGDAWEQNAELQKLFSEGPLKWELTEEKQLEKIKAFVTSYNAQNKLPIDEYVWADLCKLTFQNTTMLIYDSMSAYTCWNIFLQQLRDMHTAIRTSSASKEENPFLKLNKREVQNAWIHFLSQMYQNGHHRTVEVVHNYLHLACMVSVFKAQDKFEISPPSSPDLKQKGPANLLALKNNGLDAKGIALVMNAPLLDGLEIAGKIVIGEGCADDVKSEFFFMAEVLRIFLKNPHPLFKQPYHSSEYRKLQLAQEEHKEEYKSLQQLLWAELPLLNVPFRKMKAENTTESDIDEQLAHLTVEDPATRQHADEVLKKPRIPLLHYFMGDKSEAKKHGEPSPKRDADSLRKDSPTSAAVTKKASPKGTDTIVPPIRPQSAVRQPSPKERSEIIARAELTRQGSSGNVKQGARVSFGRTTSDRHLTPSLGSSPPTMTLLPRLPEASEAETRQYVPAYLVGFVPAAASSEPNVTPRAFILHSSSMEIPSRSSADARSRASGDSAVDDAQLRNRKGI
jgi:hypothetical protein